MASKMTAWSFSRYADYSRCPFYFNHKYLLKTIPQDTSPAMERGDKIHKAIAAWLIGKEEGLPREAFHNPRAEQILQELRQMPPDNIAVEQQWGYTANFKPTGWFGADTWFRNISDVALVYEDMTAETLDWKTGKRYGKNAEQMECQGMAVLCKFQPVTNVTARMIYLDEKGKDIEDIDEFPARVKQSLIDKWSKKVAPMFSDTVFAARPNEKCKWCPLARSKGGVCAFG